MSRETMRVMSTASDDVLSGADPEMLMRHRRIQAQRPTGKALAALLARVAVPDEAKQSKRRADWEEFIRSAGIS